LFTHFYHRIFVSTKQTEIHSLSKPKQNEKANSNRNSDSKWWWVEIQLITDKLFSQIKKPSKMKKLTATETQTVNGGGTKFN
jgi:hypothetical protein